MGRVVPSVGPHATAMPVDAGAPEPAWARWSRRSVSFSAAVLLWVLVLVTLPATVVVAAVWDLVRRSRWAAVRFVGISVVLLTAEVVGLVLGLAVWGGLIVDRDRTQFVARNHRLQQWWVGFIFEGSRRLLGARLEVEGIEHTKVGPTFVVTRHASLVDALLPAQLISRRFGVRLRYVLKRDLVWDPCLDLVGHRLLNAFVRRGGADTAADVEAVQNLARDLGPTDGVLLFPEGTRFSISRQRRALQYLQDNEPAIHRRAIELKRVLPPHLGGLFALLDADPNVDVVFCSHRGLDGIRSFGDLLDGHLVGRTIAVKFWRCPSDSIPRGRAERVAWLYDQWSKVDAFVDPKEVG